MQCRSRVSRPLETIAATGRGDRKARNSSTFVSAALGGGGVTRRRLAAVLAAAMIGQAAPQAADLHTPPRVAGFERFGRPLCSEGDSTEAVVEAGLLLLGELGCVNCHLPAEREDHHLQGKVGPVLGNVGERLRPSWLAAYLKDPRQVHPGTTMPDLLGGLPDRERQDRVEAITHLLRATGEFVEASPEAFTEARPEVGAERFRQSGCGTCHRAGLPDHPAEEPLADLLPLEGLGAKWSPKSLDAFLKNPFEARPAGRMPAAVLTNQDRGHVVAFLMGRAGSPAKGSVADETSPPGTGRSADELLAAGRKQFATSGCANCHQLAVGENPAIEKTLQAKPLAMLSADAVGCLAAELPAELPRYDLDGSQRLAIRTAIRWLQSPAAAAIPSREASVSRILTALNCYACHSRLDQGGVGRGGVLPAIASFDADGEPMLKEPARDALFTGNLQELGDEGRIPPSLTGVGDRLRPAFITEVMLKGGRDRTEIMRTLMPKWHQPVVASLAAMLAEDPKTPQVIPPLAGHAEAEVVEQGRHLVGAKALGCIKCHGFAGEKGQSLGLIDMTRMPKRLRQEWFLAYVENPQRFRSGTRMPASWPEGKTFYPDLLDGTAPGQIEAVWRYIAAGRPRPPIGAGKNPIELVPTDRPIVYRNFIESAGPRAIAVGYPEKVHLAWDADRLRLALVWREGFLDAGRHWSGRGQGFQPPLGTGLFSPDVATPLASFSRPEDLVTAPWPPGSERDAGGPADGFRFRGYVLDPAGRPAFRWQWQGRTVEDFYEPVTAIDATGQPTPTGLRRRLTVSGEGLPAAALRVARGKTIAAESDGWHRVDGYWRIRVGGPAADRLIRHEADGEVELRLPLRFEGNRVVVEEKLAW